MSAATNTAHELRIQFFDHGSVQFRGSRASLEAEGLIPAGFEWPKGRSGARWDAGHLRFSLQRCRPDDFKGTPKAWADADHWALNCTLTGPGSDFEALEVRRKFKELEAAVHRASPEGRRERDAQLNRLWKARADTAFQAFLGRVLPEQKKPGRPRKVRPADAAPIAAHEGGTT